MERIILKNKPLVEAIFELRWELQSIKTGINIDPHYKLLIGRLYDRVCKEYPFHEQLPTANIPEEMVSYVVQHRFRKGENKWPLIQIGPGIMTVNDTEGYVWEDFGERTLKAVEALFKAYPDAKENLKINRLLLRYIDAIHFDFENEDIFVFLKENLKTEIHLYEKLFENTTVEKRASQLDLRFSFPIQSPEGVIYLRFAKGKKNEIPALIWETMVEITGKDAQKIQSQIEQWLNEAHDLTDDWFFKLIEGDLLRRFK